MTTRTPRSGSLLAAAVLLAVPAAMVVRAGASDAVDAATIRARATATGATDAAAVPARAAATGATDAAADDLRPASAFAAIAGEAERSAVLFTEASRVLLHPRCVNCHPAGDHPLQGERGAAHEPPVQRGPYGRGVAGMHCGTCHQDANFDPGRVPGAPHWVLAPRTMAWEGFSTREVCEQLKDPARNGRRTLDQIAEHMAHDALIAWSWTPGADREPPPGTQERLGELIRAWVETGAACPE